MGLTRQSGALAVVQAILDNNGWVTHLVSPMFKLLSDEQKKKSPPPGEALETQTNLLTCRLPPALSQAQMPPLKEEVGKKKAVQLVNNRLAWHRIIFLSRLFLFYHNSSWKSRAILTFYAVSDRLLIDDHVAIARGTQPVSSAAGVAARLSSALTQACSSEGRNGLTR